VRRLNRQGVVNESFIREGLANRNGPESCGASPRGRRRALTGGRIGRVLSREIYALVRKRQVLRDAEAVENVGRRHPVHRHRKVYQDPARGQRPRACTQALRYAAAIAGAVAICEQS
jgi:hypothetical protein